MFVSPVSLDAKEELKEAINIMDEGVFSFRIAGTEFTVNEATVVSWIIMAVLILLSFILTRNLKVDGKISRRQQLLEYCIGGMRNFFRGIMGNGCDEFIPWLVSVGIFIGASNMVGLFGLTPPTKSVQVTAVLAITSIVLVQYAGVRKLKWKGYLKSFAKPSGVMVPINLLELVIKPLSLCMRLFGNILGAYIIMELVNAVIYFRVGVSLALSFYFDLFDGFLQAYVFVFLTALYIKDEVAED